MSRDVVVTLTPPQAHAVNEALAFREAGEYEHGPRAGATLGRARRRLWDAMAAAGVEA